MGSHLPRTNFPFDKLRVNFTGHAFAPTKEKSPNIIGGLIIVGNYLLSQLHAQYYHWPVRVLLLSSGWDQVGPRWKCHPKKFLNLFKNFFGEHFRNLFF